MELKYVNCTLEITSNNLLIKAILKIDFHVSLFIISKILYNVYKILKNDS